MESNENPDDLTPEQEDELIRWMLQHPDDWLGPWYTRLAPFNPGAVSASWAD